jgi:hypothetical protein
MVPTFFAGLFAQSVHTRHGHLTPPSRRTTKIHDPRARHKKPVFVVDFHDLERGASAIAFGFGAGHIRIVQLALQPTCRTQPPATGGFHLNGQIALPTSGGVFTSWCLSHCLTSLGGWGVETPSHTKNLSKNAAVPTSVRTIFQYAIGAHLRV